MEMFPETKRAVLICAGTCRSADFQEVHTPHTFVAKMPRHARLDVVIAINWRYACDLCGTHRTWGCEAA